MIGSHHQSKAATVIEQLYDRHANTVTDHEEHADAVFAARTRGLHECEEPS
jgi:hypothetical protein